jgi:hypothetical protein
LQDSGSQYIEAVTTSGTLCQLDNSIKALGVSGGVAVAEVVKNGISIVLNCQREGQKGLVDIRGDLLKPTKVGLQGNLFCWSFIDSIKSLFEVVSDFQTWKVLQPCFKDQGFPLVQVVGASEQKKPIVHQGSALFVGQALSYLLTDSFQASRKQFQDMELIYLPSLSRWQLNKRGVLISFARPNVF